MKRPLCANSLRKVQTCKVKDIKEIVDRYDIPINYV